MSTCRVESCTLPTKTLSLCTRHYNRANKAGLRKVEIELLTPKQLLVQFGSEVKRTVPGPQMPKEEQPIKSLDEDIAASNIALSKRVKELTETNRALYLERAALKVSRDELVTNVANLVKDLNQTQTINKGLVMDLGNLPTLVKEVEVLKRELSEAQTLNKNLAAQVLSLTADLDRATTPATPKVTTPTLVHGELKIVVVDLDSSDKLRVILKGDGCRDVAHLVGRKIRLSRLSESE